MTRLLPVLLLAAPAAAADGPLVPVGLAREDITPKTPVRLTGYANRLNESAGVAQSLYARALAVGGGPDAAVVVTADVLGVPAAVVEAVAGRLATAAGLPRERFTVCATHTHSGPTVVGNAPQILTGPVPDDHRARIDRYAGELTAALERVALRALADRKPARLGWAQGTVGFAVNRRVIENGKWVRFGETKDGPVDHALPVLRVADPDGTVRGLFVNYACHCTTLGGDFNRIHGDWAGAAAELLEADYPGAVALVAAGCGGDANPSPRGKEEMARLHGKAVADEVKRLLAGPVRPLPGPPACRQTRIELPLAPLPTRKEWEDRAKGKGGPASYAKLVLSRLDRGEALPTTVPYVVQGWAFGDELAVVFLAGEVVVDYALRLKKELDGRRLWVTAYANDVPCYVASKQLLPEGGYEVEGSMIYYDRPGPLAPEAEDAIVAAARGVIPKSFAAAKAAYPELPPALSPADSLAALRVRPGFAAKLVAAEPLVADPVDIAWGADGRMWVVEMGDYPLGLDGVGKPGGRVRVLEDTDGDGNYDKSTLFLDRLSFPTGVMPWRTGVLVTAAPSLLYAEDTDGDGRADKVTPLFTGFGEGNQQHRVNGPRWGLDNGVSLANGNSHGKVRSAKTGGEVTLRGRDLWVNPDTGEMDLLTGEAQFGRNRDDWGHWYGCNNSDPLWHYVLNDADLRRNLALAPPRPTRQVPAVPGAAPVFPASRTLARFNDYDRANRFTSACGTNVYRDDLFGPAFAGNTFTCEPVHNLVSRLVLTPSGVSFVGARAPGEEHAEFLASTDGWFRPAAVHTGPDGALYVVDMYRQVIEHPQWIPLDWQKHLDLRAGHDKGRVYRVAPVGVARRPVPRLDKLTTAELVAALDSPSGWQRDTVQQLLVWKVDPAAADPLRQLAERCGRPVARMQALCTLDGLGALAPADVLRGLADAHPGVRRQAVRLARKQLSDPAVAAALVARTDDPDPKVRLELAACLGDLPGPVAGPALAKLLSAADDEYTRAAALSSLTPANVGAALDGATGPAVEGLYRMAAALGDEPTVRRAAARVGGNLAAVAGLLDGLDARPGLRPKLDQLPGWLDRATVVAADEAAAEAERVAAIQLLARGGVPGTVFVPLLGPRHPPAVQDAALAALARLAPPDAADRLLAGWKGYSPRLRSRVADALVGREAWTDKLLAAVEAGTVPAGQIDASARQRLLRMRNDKLRGRAEAVFAETATSDRAKVVERYAKELPPTGDAGRGRDVFRKTCAACHLLDGAGHAVGPDLMTTTDKPADWFLAALFDPNRAVEDRYLEYQAATADGRVLTGLLAAETGAGVVLRMAEGKEATVLRRDLDGLTSTGRSPMPDGLEKELPPQAVADLLAYLGGLRPQPRADAAADGGPARR